MAALTMCNLGYMYSVIKSTAEFRLCLQVKGAIRVNYRSGVLSLHKMSLLVFCYLAVYGICTAVFIVKQKSF